MDLRTGDLVVLGGVVGLFCEHFEPIERAWITRRY